MSDTFFLFGFKGVLFLWVLGATAFMSQWLGQKVPLPYVFSYIIGSIVAGVILAFTYSMSVPWFQHNPFLTGAGVLVIIGMWKFLFGPWKPDIKAVVLGTFIFWIAVNTLQQQTDAERMATLLASVVAAVPAAIWCLLFLADHRERISIILLTFFAGMLSTAPILFYDHVVRKGYELHFFLFRVVPENFMRSSETFVLQSFTGQKGVASTSIAITVVSFLLVAIIEEWSKHWVTRKSDRSYFRSVSDVLQLSIIAAIGFAFAENIINPNYFIAFVRDYLLNSDGRQWGLFFGSVFGRSIITNMVHIVSSGVLGYFYGLAFFAGAILQGKKELPRWSFIAWATRTFQLDVATVYRKKRMFDGLMLAFLIHGFFNTATSLTDVLPGHPSTLGQLFHYSGLLSGLSIIALPAILYVFGGWFLLQYLFARKLGRRDYGQKSEKEVFVSDAITA